MRVWLNDKRTRNFRRSSGVTHGSPAAFCIADDGGGLIKRIVWRETEYYLRVGRHRGRCEGKERLVSEEVGLFDAGGKERRDNGETFRHMFHGE